MGSKPIITGTTHTLPFDKLSPADFERMCLWLVQREGFEQAQHLGASGGEQGRDIVALRDAELWAFQCKRVEHFRPNDGSKEVEKVLALPESERPIGLVFLVSCDVSARTRQSTRDRCAGKMVCEFWAGTELDEKAKRYPDIVEEFFGETRSWLPFLSKLALSELICVPLAILAVLVSQRFVPLAASYDQVMLYSLALATVLAVPTYLICRFVRNHLHVTVASLGAVGLLLALWLFARLATHF